MNWEQKQKLYEPYRKTKIESGQLYQDFVVDVLAQSIGLIVQVYGSRVYQMAVDESRNGVEIKHDEKYARTGNLWIEVGEKARPRPGDYTASGIHRGDNSWLYVIGDYDTIFLFPKRYLLALAPRYRTLENNTKTSVGFLFPDADARRYAAYVLTLHAEQVVSAHVTDLEELGRQLHAVVKADVSQLALFGANT